MKINPTIRYEVSDRVKLRFRSLLAFVFCLLATHAARAADTAIDVVTAPATAASTAPATVPAPAIDAETQRKNLANDAHASKILSQVVVRLVRGSAFDAQLQQKVWAADREVIGVGTYLQSGSDLGRYRMQMKLHTGRDAHHFTQISDGRLAWTRTEIEKTVGLRRVDVSRLNQWIEACPQSHGLPPGYLAGGLVEMIDTIDRDYDLQVTQKTFQGDAMIIIVGTLKPSVRSQILKSTVRTELAQLHPTMVRLAIATKNDAMTAIGKGLPIRFEYWSDPVGGENGETATSPKRRMVSLLELKSIRQITSPDEIEFRFENRDLDIDFFNETDRYLQRYGLSLTDSQRVQLRR
jgi:hypothetical protein